MIEDPYPRIPANLKRETALLPPYVEAALFLLCGMIIGGGATVLLLDYTLRQSITRPEMLPDHLLTRMESRLGLTEEQATRAEAIIATHFSTLDSIQREVQPEVQRTIDALRDELAAILEPEQREIWETRFEEIRAKWRPGPLVPTDEEEKLVKAANP